MKIISVFFLLLSICTWGQAQPKLIALEKQLAESRADTQRSRLLNELDWVYAELKNDSAVIFLNNSLQTAKKSQNQQATLYALYRMSYVYVYFVHDETKAMQYLNECIALATQLKDNLLLAKCYFLWSTVATHQKADKLAMVFKKAIDYAYQTDDYYVKAESHVLNFIHFEGEQKYNEASKEAFKAMMLVEKRDAKMWLSYSLDYCDFLQKEGKTAQINTTLQKMARVAKTIPIDTKNYVLMNDLARLETKLRNFDKAEQLYLQVLAVERAKSWPDTFHLFNVYRYLLDNYLVQNQYQKAYDTRTQLTDIELFLNQKRQAESAKIQMAKTEAAQEVALVKAQQKEQNLYLIGSITVSILLISLALIIWRSRQRSEQQKTELSQLNTTKDKIFAILSHDLRSPVAALKNYMMLVDWGTLSQEEFANTTKHLNNTLNNTHNMLENVLNWSITQLGGLKPNTEDVNIAEVISEQIRWQEVVAKEKNITILSNIPTETLLTTDKNHLSVIIRNLLQNALKFTPTGGEIAFDFEEIDNQKVLSIKDSGAGIPPEQLRELFQINKNKPDSKRGKEQGTGLGLVLVKDLVELNKGKIEVERNHPQGATFKITF